MKFQRGFSLVESLVASCITAMVLTGLFTLYLNNKRSYAIHETLVSVQDNGRYGINILSGDVRRAGFFGGIFDISSVTGTSAPLPAAASCPGNNTDWGRMLSQSIFGLDDTGDGYDCIPNNARRSAYVRGDVIAIRYATPVATITDPQRLYLRTAFVTGRLFTGDLAQDPANALTSSATDHELAANAFYIGNTQRSCLTQPIPALFRKTLNSHGVPEAEELVSGIEDLQLQYGLDSDHNGAVDLYTDASAISQWQQVIAIKLWILARAECPEADYKNSHTYILGNKTFAPRDNYRRQLHSTTVALRNRALPP